MRISFISVRVLFRIAEETQSMLANASTFFFAFTRHSRNRIHMMSEIDEISNTVYRGKSSLVSAKLLAKNTTISSKNVIEVDTSAPLVQSVRISDAVSFNQTYMAGDSMPCPAHYPIG